MAAEAFFASLPSRLTADEQDLVAQLERVGAAAKRVLPPCVTIQAWAERRVLEADADKSNASGLVYIAVGKGPKARRGEPPVRNEGSHTSLQAAQDKRARDKEAGSEEFFDSLPADGFSQNEEDLRDAILKYLRGWRDAAPPILLDMLQERAVDAAVRATLPRDVSLRSWIEARLASEVELTEARRSGEYTVSIKGRKSDKTPMKPAAKQTLRKRTEVARERADQAERRDLLRPARRASSRSASPPPQQPPVPLRPRSRSQSPAWSAHSAGARSRSRSAPLLREPSGPRLAQRTHGRSRSRSDSQQLNARMPHNETPSSYQAEKVEAVVLRRPALSSGEPVWQAEIEMPQGGINHSGRARTFNIRGPPRKTEEAAEEDAKQLTDASGSGPKTVRQLANSMHRG